MKKLFLASALSALTFSAAQAADPVAYEPAPAAAPERFAYDWSGLYAGLYGGYGWGDSVSSTPDLGFGGDYDSLATEPDGAALGLTFGYNKQFGSLVAGVEGEVGYSWAEDDVTFDDIRAITEYGFTASLTGRLGYAFDRVLLYGKGGLALAVIENVAGDLDSGVFDESDVTRTSGIRAGYTIGGGAEFAFDSQWTAKVEYMFSDFGSETSGNGDGDTYFHENEMHTLKVGVNYRF